MNKLIIYTFSLVAVVSSGRLEPEYLPPFVGSATAHASSSAGSYAGVPLNYENVNNGDGTYRFSYDTPTGISAHESGSPRASGAEGAAVTSEGGFSFRTPDGQQVSLTYTADENGFHPTGSHIPTSPPIPEAILRSLEYNRQHASSDDGSYSGGNHHGY